MRLAWLTSLDYVLSHILPVKPVSKDRYSFNRRGFLTAASACIVAPAIASAAPSRTWFDPQATLKGITGGTSFSAPAAPSKNDPNKYAADPYVPHWNSAGRDLNFTQVKNAGFGYIRVFVDPGPMLDAEDHATLAPLIAQITDAINDTLSNGLLFELVLGNESHPVWSAFQIADGVGGKKFEQYVRVCVALAKELAKFPLGTVRFELINEPTRNDPPWQPQLEYLYARVRAAAPSLTLNLTGYSNAGSLPLGKALDPSFADENVMWNWHFYEPYIFTLQGFWNSAPAKYIHRLEFPPNPANKSVQMAKATSQINADNGLTMLQKISMISVATKALDNYYNTPQGLSYITAYFDKIAAWADANRIPRNRIVLGEFGVLRDVYDLTAASDEDANRWLALVVGLAEAREFRWCAYVFARSFALTQDKWNADLQRVEWGNWRTGALAALGLGS